MTTQTIRSAAFASLSAVCAFATVAFAAPAHAAPADVAPTAIVTVADLNLADAHDVARLDRRMRSAVTTVCGSADIRDLARMARVNECRTQAMAGAAPQVATLIERAHDTRFATAATIKVAAN